MPFFLFHPDKYSVYPSFSKILTGSLYVGICLLGISAIFYPKKCENTFMFKNQGESKGDLNSAALRERIRFRGHHPECVEFSANRITVRTTTVVCAACAGLLIGAVGGLIGASLYFFVGFAPFLNWTALLVGYVGVLLGLFQFRLRGYIKLAANGFFVLGSLAVLISADQLGASLFINLYVVGLIVFLLLTRIMISEWNNKRICMRCGRCESTE